MIYLSVGLFASSYFYLVVYDVKCIIDELLDATEDMSDAVINALGPVLQGLLGKASATVCRAGVEVAGLCV